MEKALAFAAEKHKGQVRKFEAKPYIYHPMDVSLIASTITLDENILAAALLHDTLEDTDTTKEDIIDLFGEKVLQLILSETENKYSSLPKRETWKKRKEEALNVLKNSDDLGVKILWLSDKLSNIRSCYRYYLEMGDKMFERFNQHDKKMHEWYYKTVGEYVKELSDTSAYREYIELINIIF